MTTINNLPIEILSHIFWLAALDARKPCSRSLKGGYIDPWFSSDYKTTAPFVFLKVCGHWRAVAKSTHLLWSTFNVSNFYFHKGECCPLPLEALAHWLSLSDPAPLDLYLTTPYGESPQGEYGPELPIGHTEPILRLLVKDSHRWQSLSTYIGAPTCQFLGVLLHDLAQDALPNLRCLDLDATAGDAVVDFSTLTQVIGGMGSLRELHLNSKSIKPSLRGIQWSRLTTIVLHVSVTLDEAAFCLAQSTSAETVAFNDLYYWTDPDASYPQHTTLPCLKSLTLRGSDGCHKLLDVFDFPSLESLTIRLTPRSPFPHILSLRELIERSQCPLKNLLIILRCTLSPSDAAEYLLNPCLQKVPQVVLACDHICREFEEIAHSSRNDVPPIWIWKGEGTQNVGWKPKLDGYFEKKTARLINLTT